MYDDDSLWCIEIFMWGYFKGIHRCLFSNVARTMDIYLGIRLAIWCWDTQWVVSPPAGKLPLLTAKTCALMSFDSLKISFLWVKNAAFMVETQPKEAEYTLSH